MNRIWLNALRAAAGNSQGYASVVAGLSAPVIAYWPGTLSGTDIVDASGNNRGGTATNVTTGPGLTDHTEFIFAEDGYLEANAALTAAIDPTEYSISMIVRVSKYTSGTLVPRLHALYTDGVNNYNGTLEVRWPGSEPGNRLDVYGQSSGQSQSMVGFDYLPDDERVHIVVFNSESAGQAGVYYNGLYLPVGITIPNLPVTVVTATYPRFGIELTGAIQEIVIMDTGIPSQSDVDALKYGAFAQPSTAITYQLTDTFTGDESAPLTSPRASGLVVTDTGNLMSTASGSLIWTGKTVDVTTPRVMTPSAYERLEGRAVIIKLTPGSIIAGWRATNTASPNTLGVLFQSGTLFGYLNAALPNLGSATTNGTVEYSLAFVRDRFGGVVIIKGGAFSEWTPILFMDTLLADWYGGFGVGSASTSNAINTFKVVNLPAPFNKSFDLAETRLAGKVSAGQTFTHPADHTLTYGLATRPTSGTNDVRFRVQDASNYMQLTVSNAGTIVLNQVVAGVPTALKTAAVGMVSGDRLWLHIAGSRIQCLVRLSGSYTSAFTETAASNFTSETDGEITSLGTNGRISDVLIIPRTLSGDAVTVLDEAVA